MLVSSDAPLLCHTLVCQHGARAMRVFLDTNNISSSAVRFARALLAISACGARSFVYIPEIYSRVCTCLCDDTAQSL